MKTARLVFGILTLILCVVVLFQSCAVGIHNSIENNGDRGGAAGFFVFVFMVVSGVLSITAKSKRGGFTTAGFYFLAGCIAILNNKVFKDLSVWGMLNLCFALIIFIMAAFQREKGEDFPLIPTCAEKEPPQQPTPAEHVSVQRQMFCGQCGKPIEGGNRFCVYCGSPVSARQEAKEVD